MKGGGADSQNFTVPREQVNLPGPSSKDFFTINTANCIKGIFTNPTFQDCGVNDTMGPIGVFLSS